MNIEDLKLTPRELEIWRMTAEGVPSKQMHDHIGVSKTVVDACRTRLYRKLGVRTNIEATRLAVSLGVVSREWAPAAVGGAA